VFAKKGFNGVPELNPRPAKVEIVVDWKLEGTRKEDFKKINIYNQSDQNIRGQRDKHKYP
jgi:hypothetical protein